MTYALGVDLGTTYTAAAIHRDGRIEMVTLGDRAASVPSVIFLKEDETILTGEAARRRGLTEPERVAREFKRRVGDPAPLLLGHTPYSAEALLSKLLRWTVDTVTEREGEPPSHITVTHPANWGPFKKDLLGQAIRMADLEADTITEPEAAAVYYASNERVEAGAVIAVYDLGGGTFDVAVLRKTDGGWEILGQPEGIERLGGIDFDEAVFTHVRQAIEAELSALDPEDPAVIDAVARLRQDCVDAKEALSSDTDVSIPVLLPNLQTKVRLTRSELEGMIRPTLRETVAATQRALRSASVEPEGVHAVLLVGGSSRIPLVAQLVTQELRRPVAVDAHPKHAIALGAAIAAAGGSTEAGDLVVDVEVEEEPPVVAAAPPVPPTPAAPVPVSAATPGPPASPTSGKPRSRAALVAAVAAVAALVAVGAVVAGGGGGSDDPEAPVEAAEEQDLDDLDGLSGEVDDISEGLDELDPEADFEDRPYAEIVSIDIVEDRYVIQFAAYGFEPSLTDPYGLDVRFFWDDTEPINAGGNGPDPGYWLQWDLPYVVDDPFFDVANQPLYAGAICVVIGTYGDEVADVDFDGLVDTDTGNCMELPPL